MSSHGFGGAELSHRRGPPESRPLVPKRPHRRGPFACDECRLRKRACDSKKPCGPCRRSEHDCTYLFREPIPRPTTTIRALQGRLRQAQAWLQHIQASLPRDALDIDLSECLRTLDSTFPEKDETSSNSSLTRRPGDGGRDGTGQGPFSNAAQNHGLLIPEGVRLGKARLYYGPFSDVAFILRTVETLQVIPSTRPSSEAVGTESEISALLDRFSRCDLPNSVPSTKELAYDIPKDTVDLVNSVLERRDLILSFLAVTDIRQTALDPFDKLVTMGSLSLMHLVLALAYLCDSERHLGTRCNIATQTALKHFEIGISLDALRDTSSEVSMAARLCAATFLMTAGRHSLSYAYITSACSTALRLGLLSDGRLAEDMPPQIYKPRLRLLASTLFLDMMGSIVLDLPTCIRAELWPPKKFSILAHKAESHDDLYAAALLRQSALLAIALSARNQTPSGLYSHHGDCHPQVFQKALRDFRGWTEDAASLMTRLGSAPQYHSIKKELEITYHLGQVILFRPHLYYIRDMYAGKRISVAESYYALACIKAASCIVPLAESMAPLPGSWPTMHAVFSSTMCLIFLVASNPATTLPSVAWQRARRGAGIIAANKCIDNASTFSFEILKVVTHILRQTVYIDFDRIEALTPRRCNFLLDTGGDPLGGANSTSQDGYSSEECHDGLSLIDLAAFEAGGQANNEADRMLQQAEALETDLTFQDWFHLDYDDNEEE